MASWFTWQLGNQRQATGERRVSDPCNVNSVPYRQEAEVSHALDLNAMYPPPLAPNTPLKPGEVDRGSPSQVTGPQQVPHPAGVPGSKRSRSQHYTAQLQELYSSPNQLGGNIVPNPYMLSGYHHMPPSPGGFSIQYKNNIFFSPEATSRTGATVMPPFPFVFSTKDQYTGTDGHALKTKTVTSVASSQLETRGTQSVFPICIDQSDALNLEASPSLFLKSADHTNMKGENLIVDSDEIYTVPLAPITPEKINMLGHNAATEIVNLVDNSENDDNDSQKQVGEEIHGIFSNQDATQASLSSTGVSLQQTGNQIQAGVETQGIDLNKTPQQKPKKKKHRPKVIREGKTARKSKQTTPKSDTNVVETIKPNRSREKGVISSNLSKTTPKAEDNGTQTVKRKYVRKKGLNASEGSPLKMTVDSRNMNSKRSAKRSLNFDSEEVQAKLRTQSCSLDFQCAEETENMLDHSSDILHNNRRSTENFPLQSSGKIQDTIPVVVPHAMFDLNHSLNEVTGCCIELQENLIPVVQPLRREVLKQNLKDLARKRDSLEISSSCLDTTQSESQALNCEKENIDLLDIVMANKINYSHNYHDMLAQNVPQYKRVKQNNCKGSYGSKSSAPRFLKSPIVMVGEQHDGYAAQLHGECMLTSDQTQKKRNQSVEAPIHVNNFTSLISGIISTPQNLINQSPVSGALETQITSPSTTAKTLAGQTRKFLPVDVRIKSTNSLHGSQQESGVAYIDINSKTMRSHQIISRERHNSDFVPKSMSMNGNSMDMLVSKLKSLTIKEGVEHGSEQPQYHNALVPYAGHGMMVPAENLLDSSRKRRSRPKVDLDSETNRVWMLLMGKEGTVGPEEMDKDKERWWEEQRRFFRGRVDSFIARMHQVQGDRRFSRWKGSVVDSVVGVFLTQNVSDHLSSSAFMSLAARFPSPLRRQNLDLNIASDNLSTVIEEECVPHLDGIKSLEKCNQQKADQGSVYHERQNAETATQSLKDIRLQREHKRDFVNLKGLGIFDENDRSPMLLPEKKEDTFLSLSEIPLAFSDDMRSLEGFFSSQSSVISSQNSLDSTVQSVYPHGPNSETGSEVNYVTSNDGEGFLEASSTSFMELLQMEGTSLFQELYHNESETFQTKYPDTTNRLSKCFENTMTEYDFGNSTKLEDMQPSLDGNACRISPELRDYARASCDSSVSSIYYNPHSGCLEMNNLESVQETVLSLPSNCSGHTNASSGHSLYSLSGSSQEVADLTIEKVNFDVIHNHLSGVDINRCSYPQITEVDAFSRGYPPNPAFKETVAKHLPSKNNESTSYSPILHTDMRKQQLANSNSPLPDCGIPQHMNICFTEMHTGKTPNGYTSQLAANVSPQKHSVNTETVNAGKEKQAKVKKDRSEKQQNNAFDWDSLRKQTCNNAGPENERNHDAMDSIDWEAIRSADVKELSKTIRERGMNNMLAERIKDFLDRLVREHGSIDLEWLRDVPPEKAKDYLLSIRGLGLKSVECVRLLTLHHLAFPVDTNVGRICVRLGWVPLQPLPESLQLHLLEMYPLLETIQKYLWPRLCTLDQRTLYELHYQMITFGKVFCTKSKPNCNACPMRAECKHFASAFASARLALPGPEDKSLVNAGASPTAWEQNYNSVGSHLLPLQLEGNPSTMKTVVGNCEPIIEEPASPEPECIEYSERDIEDAFYDEDSDGIPTIHLNVEQFTDNLKNIIQENNMQLQEYDVSKALVALMPHAASIPQPKLKNVNRLRTEHQVYELPDSHPLLDGLDKRETDDPSPYLLAIWSPGETANSIEPPQYSCNAQDFGKLCDDATCGSCNSTREAQAQKVRCTLLIPCRTAMKGSFPLNGTYFQVNEVFADHSSSREPIDVPRQWIWNLPRRTVYFGTSVTSIFRGLTTEEIQHCFWKGFVCVRGFDRETRRPRPLTARLHFPASKAVKGKKVPLTHE